MKKQASREEVLKIARYMGCRGAHQDESGNWMPCADMETLQRLSSAAENDEWLKQYEKDLYSGNASFGTSAANVDINGRKKRGVKPYGIEPEPFTKSDSSGNYTNPGLRESIKKRIMAGSNGGKPGQWSARKAQLVAQEYKKRGGKYRGKKTKKQRSLSKWTSEKWTTSDGKPAIRQGGTRRYLPAKAWSKLSPSQRAATNKKKIEGSKRGRQFVANTEAAARARKNSVKSASPIIVKQTLVMQRFAETEGRGPGPRRKKRGKRWEKLTERGPEKIISTPNLGLTSKTSPRDLNKVATEVKQVLTTSRFLID